MVIVQREEVLGGILWRFFAENGKTISGHPYHAIVEVRREDGWHGEIRQSAPIGSHFPEGEILWSSGPFRFRWQAAEACWKACAESMAAFVVESYGSADECRARYHSIIEQQRAVWNDSRVRRGRGAPRDYWWTE